TRGQPRSRTAAPRASRQAPASARIAGYRRPIMRGGKLVGIAAVWAVSLVGVGLWAQGPVPGPQVTARTTGSIAGTVEDSQGGVIPGATLVLISESRGTRSAPFISAIGGDFLFPSLTPDVYTIEVTM